MSRGLTPSRLISCKLWWQGPPWLKLSPQEWPRRLDIDRPPSLPELKSSVLIIKQPPQDPELWYKYSSFSRLLTITAWCLRFRHYCKNKNVIKEVRLTGQELEAARIRLIHLCQQISYPSELGHLEKGQPVPRNSALLPLRPLLGKDGLMRVGGRIANSGRSYAFNHPIILPKSSVLTKLIALQVHFTATHAGPNTMLSILAADYSIVGAKSLLRQISRNCVVCQRVYARSATQLMGQLPTDRVVYSPPFNVTGLDYAGPLLIKRGSARKPLLLKSYACLFICCTTRAVHIELVSDLTSEGFLAALSRFTDRRGCPATILSDNI